MLRRPSILVTALLAALCACMMAPAAQAAETMTLTVNTVGPIAFTMTPGSATNPVPTAVTVTLDYNISPTRSSLTLYAYFTSTSQALKHQDPANTMDVPASAIQASVNGGAYRTFNEAIPVGTGTGLMVWQQPLIVGATHRAIVNTTLRFNINLSSLSQLPPDSYSGTFVFQAEAI